MKKTLITMITACFLVLGFSGVSSAASTTYTVQKGDTLSKIATKHNLTVKQLKSWNRLKNDTITIKQVLKLSKATVKTAAVSNNKNYKIITVTATAYTASCKGCSGRTAIGLNLKQNSNVKAISVDPKIIPLGTKVHVAGYGDAIAADTGSSIKGNKIDVFMPSRSKALSWGVKTVKVTVYK